MTLGAWEARRGCVAIWCDAMWARRQETLKDYQEKKEAAKASGPSGREVSEQHQQVLLASNRLYAAVPAHP